MDKRYQFALAAVAWGALAMLLWTIGGGLRGEGVKGDIIVRNNDVLAMFASHDRTAAIEAAAEERAAVGLPPAGAASAPKSQLQTQPQPSDPEKSAFAVPAPVDPNAALPGGRASGEAEEGKIDLNRASAAELDKLPGIGPSKAKAIVEYREKQGAFRTIEELKRVKGIGDKTFESLKPFITAGP